MNYNFIKKLFVFIGIFLVSIYLIFLLLPFIISPVLNSYIPKINEEIKKTTGFITEIEGFSILTTPKLTVGAKVNKFLLNSPKDENIVSAKNIQAKISLIPLLAKKIEIDIIKADDVDIKINLLKDGSFEIEKYLVKEEKEENALSEKDIQNSQSNELPFGIKLSDKMPDIKINAYKLAFIDSSNREEYTIEGDKIYITKFVLNKSIKIDSSGKFILKNREQFKYDIDILNYIMPKFDINDVISAPQNTVVEDNKNDFKINILDILKNIYKYKLTADISSNLVLHEHSYNGYLNIDNLSIKTDDVSLPASELKLVCKNKNININSNLYTDNKEVSVISGNINVGKNKNIDLNFKSKAELNNIIRIINSLAKIFGINDLQTLSAKGQLDADFNIKSNFKTVNSNGYLKIPSANVNYGLYNIKIEDIIADILLNDNNIDIKKIGFSIFNQPLNIVGTIKKDSTVDIVLNADKLSIKGLLLACGQTALLKENQINSGNISINADLKGKLENIKPVVYFELEGLDLKNIPANTMIKIPNGNLNLTTDGKDIDGKVSVRNININNPAAKITIPQFASNIKQDYIEITDTPIQIEKINLSLNGKIKNYLSEKILLEFNTKGDINSYLNGDINLVKQTLNLVYNVPNYSTIVVPMFDKSKLIFGGKILINGSLLNPLLSGNIYVPNINLPEIPVVIDNMNIKLNGKILNGQASIEKFANNGIIADSITTDFSMKNEYFYLNNLKGNAFDGKFNGNIIYNINNAKTDIVFKGEGMNAEKAVAGAVGIKNALSGTLGFNTNMKISVLPDFNDMMKSLSGNLNFEIKNGAFGSIGRLENILQAGNILGNSLLKTTVASFSNVASIKNSAQFDYIKGDMSFSGGNANLKNIQSTGKSIAYYVSGKYNLINGYTDVVVLGRLDASIVKLLGPLGELSAEKILSFIPNFGSQTAKLFNSLTADPDKEKTEKIPQLSNNNLFKDFKVEFRGLITNPASLKTFKWLSKPDLSAIEQQSISDTIKSFKTNINSDIDTTVDSVKNAIEDLKNQKEAIKDAANGLKNLFK
ncbi:AsmA family protein [bacterium]|nr:AsmA family protein [bacterium]